MTTEKTHPASAPIPEPPLVHHVELAISYILRGGVILSILLVLLGLTLTFIHHPDYVNHALPLQKIPEVAHDFPHTASETLASLAQLRGQGFVILGILVLLATPVIRVAASIIAFALQKDRIFVALTLLVLAILILSFFLGKSEAG